jgi:hypothetical protein
MREVISKAETGATAIQIRRGTMDLGEQQIRNPLQARIKKPRETQTRNLGQAQIRDRGTGYVNEKRPGSAENRNQSNMRSLSLNH